MEHEHDPAQRPTIPVQTQPQWFERLRAAQSVFDTIGDGFLVVDSARRVLCANNAARFLLGEDIEGIKPGEWETRFSYRLPDGAAPDTLDDLPLMRALKGEAVTRQELHVSGANIRSVWLSVTARPINNDEGRFEWAYILLRDINLRKWSEAKRRLHGHAMDSAREGIVIVDALEEGEPIIYVNEGFERLTGYSQDEMLDQPMDIIFHNAIERERSPYSRPRIRRITPVTLELECARKDETRYWSRISISPVRDQSGQLTHYIAVISDITDLIHTEIRLQETMGDLEEANEKLSWANKRMKRDLQAAAKVQRALLPESLPEIDCLKFAWAFEPDEELSGDILNVFSLDDHNIGMYVLDVTDHGVASSMLSVTVSHLLMPVRSATSLVYTRSGGVYSVAPPAKVAARLAMRFRWDLEIGQFFTIVYGVFNCADFSFRYVCAGHPPPVLVDGDGARALDKTGDMPIGLSDVTFEEREARLKGGDRLYLYSDGVVEAMNIEGELFGEQRFQDALGEGRSHSLHESVSGLVKRVKQWRKDGPLKDDTSILALELKC